MSAKLVEFPIASVQDIPARLRELADDIELGNYGDAHSLGWIIDEGDGIISVGLLGTASCPAAELHLLCGIAMRKIEGDCI